MTIQERIWVQGLQSRIKSLEAENKALKSGEQLQRQREYYRKELDTRDRRLAQKDKEIAAAHAETANVLKISFQTLDDVEAKHAKEIERLNRELRKAQDKTFEAERQRDEWKGRCIEERKKRYEAETQAEDLQGQLLKLTAQINKDYTNSSISSSRKVNRGTIHNSREKTGRKPGAQKGHEHHGRKRQKPTSTVKIPTPDELKDKKQYRPTGKKVKRQMILVHVTTEVIEYEAEEFICIATGKKVHAPFPAEVKDDVNYDGTVKALAYMLNNLCYVSIDKTRTLLKELTGGVLAPSNGMICGLSKEFSLKTREERGEIFNELLAAPVLHADFTFGRAAGHQASVIVTTDGIRTLYQGREKKGFEGIRGSPVELYQGTLVSDHESSLLHYGTRHQECLAHVERYLRSSMENEPKRTWSSKMLDLVKKAIHYRNEVERKEEELDDTEVAALEAEYDKIIEIARNEYEYEPPSDYFRDGYNLFKRMSEDKQDYLLFLHDLAVPPTNNDDEQKVRVYKRKGAQVMCFRSMEGHNNFCDGLSVMDTFQSEDKNMYEEVTKCFNRPKPIQPRDGQPP